MSKDKCNMQDLQAEKAWQEDERFYIDSVGFKKIR